MPATPAPRTSARRTAIADAAIEVLASQGMRGLTHRAVDRGAALPSGSTSYYFRTRQALLQAIVNRLVELDQADQADETPGDIDALVASAADALDLWLSRHRSRTLARYACLLEATRYPEFEAIRQAGAVFREYAGAVLARAGAPDPQWRGRLLVAAIDGLLFDRLANTGGVTAPEPGTPASRADLRAAIRLLVEAVLAQPPSSADTGRPPTS